MYLDYQVEIPNEPGKITRFRKGKATYIRYAAGRIYNAEKKYNVPDHKTIGKLVSEESMMMIPNENFLKYFGDVELPEIKTGVDRSSCLKIGAFLVVRKIMEEYNLPHMITKYLGSKDAGLFLDLATYSIITEGNAASIIQRMLIIIRSLQRRCTYIVILRFQIFYELIFLFE